MSRLIQTWRRLARGLLAAAMIMLAAGPALDVVICGGEPARAEAAIHPADLDHPGGFHSHEDGAPCHHGHCHHASAFVPQALPEPIPAIAHREQFEPGRVKVLASRAAFDLKRPPRA